MNNESGVDLGAMMGFFDDAFRRWDNLDASIKMGKPHIRADVWMNEHPGSWDRYHRNLKVVAGLLIEEILRKVKLPAGAKMLLDVGGSHGLYSVGFCWKYPNVSAVIIDSKEARNEAETTINAAGMAHRISFREGDFLTDNPGDHYDVALIFNTIRVFSKEDAMTVLLRTKQALKKGGIVLIADQFCTKSLKRSFAMANAYLIVLELINASIGRPYSSTQVSEMLERAGYSKPTEIFLSRSPGISLLKAFNI
jgi:cyclopropane fatty-acyl-phospholipid synthase-like methyltransferase